MNHGIPPDRLTSEPPVVAIPPRVDVRELVLPLDPYELDPREQITVNRAHRALMAECLRRHGIDIELPDLTTVPWARHEQRYGLTDEAHAARYGYHVPEIADPPHRREPPLPDDIADDCVDRARRRLNQGAPDLPEPRLAQLSRLRVHRLSRQDSRTRAVFSAWSRCMRESGFSYADPMAANNDPAFATGRPTENEIAVAVADVRCKRKVGLVEVWFAVETAYQRQVVEARHDELELIRQAIQVQLANARAVLAGVLRP